MLSRGLRLACALNAFGHSSMFNTLYYLHRPSMILVPSFWKHSLELRPSTCIELGWFQRMRWTRLQEIDPDVWYNLTRSKSNGSMNQTMGQRIRWRSFEMGSLYQIRLFRCLILIPELYAITIKHFFCHFGNSCEKTEPLSDFFHRINMFHRFNFSWGRKLLNVKV